MKKKAIVSVILLLLVLAAGAFLFYTNKENRKKVTVQANTTQHTGHSTDSSMAVDTALSHLLKPVDEQVVARITTIRPENSTRIFSLPVQGTITYDQRRQESISSRVSGRIERMLVKYNYQPVSKGQLIMEIYSPDLAAAQREMLFIYQADRNDVMLQKAKQRLSLLGMPASQINEVLRTGRILYRVPVYSPASGYILEKSASGAATPFNTPPSGAPAGSGDGMNTMGGGTASPSATPTEAAPQASPILVREGQYVGAGQTIFTIYNSASVVAEFAFNPSLASEVKKGQKLVFYKTADPQTVYSGVIGLIQPTFRAGSNFTLARVYVADHRFKIGQLITATIPILNRGWWLPHGAVLTLGSQSVVFKKEDNVFVPKTVKAKLSAEGMVLIEEDISGWEVASNASYMVDSESFIKTDSDSLNQ